MIVNSQQTLDDCLQQIRDAYAEWPHIKVTIKSSKRRSLDANALSWAWYKQISEELQEGTIEDVHAECKLTLGVPILRANHDWFRQQYDEVVKPHPYETKLRIMPMLAVTSIMTRDEMRQYLDDMVRTYAERGVVLESIRE